VSFVSEKRYVCNVVGCHVILPNYLLYRKHNALHNREDFGRKRKHSISSGVGSDDEPDESEDDVRDSSYEEDSDDGDSTCWILDKDRSQQSSELADISGFSEDFDFCNDCDGAYDTRPAIKQPKKRARVQSTLSPVTIDEAVHTGISRDCRICLNC
jgi:hypothetical protein